MIQTLRCGCLLFSLSLPASAQDSRQEPTSRPELHFASGKVTVQGGRARIDLPPGFRYLQQRDARYVVEKLWGNGSRPFVLGMVVPPGVDVADAESWAVVVTYDDSGHVDDSDAKSLDFDAILKSMQEATRERSEEGKAHGQRGMTLVGWAEPPHYDPAQKKVYWAKKLQVEGTPEQTLNYSVRFLGRSGVLEMIAVGSVEQLAQIADGAKQLLPCTEFTAGNRYEEFESGTDKVAAYGIGGLIAGGMLAKAGFFKVVGLFFVKFAKPLLIGAVALFALLGRMFGMKKKNAGAQGSNSS